MPGDSESTTRNQRVDQLLARDRWHVERSRPWVPGDHTATGTVEEFPAGDLICTCNWRDEPPTRREIKRFHTPGTRREPLAHDLPQAEASRAGAHLRRRTHPMEDPDRYDPREVIGAIENAPRSRKRPTLAATATGTGKRRTMIAPIERGPAGQT